MAEKRRAVCVYGASREEIASKYKEAAYELGRLAAESGLTLVSGGGRAGLMRAAIDGATSVGGRTIGVLPKFMADRHWGHPDLTVEEVTPDMHRRKERMAVLSDACIAMPGGCGTFEELLEIITWRKLGLYDGLAVILNTDGYYNPLIAMLNSAISEGFMAGEDTALWRVASTPAEAIDIVMKSF